MTPEDRINDTYIEETIAHFNDPTNFTTTYVNGLKWPMVAALATLLRDHHPGMNIGIIVEDLIGVSGS